MKKNDIIAVYAEKNNVTKKAATEVVGSVIDIIKDGILTEGVVDITGFVKLEKVYKETSQERGVPKQTPKKKPENKKNTGKRYADGKGEKR